MALLDGRTILIVENDPAIGLDLSATLVAAGATPVGPANSVESAFTLIADHAIDAAILDIRLHKDELVFPVADTLQALRQRLFDVHPTFGRIGYLAPAKAFDVAALGAKGDVGKARFVSAVVDPYLKNPIARASATMAELSASRGPKRLMAAE